MPCLGEQRGGVLKVPMFGAEKQRVMWHLKDQKALFGTCFSLYPISSNLEES